MVTEKAQDEWAEAVEEAGAIVTSETHLQPGDIITKASEDTPFAMRVHSLAYKGYAVVWDTLTGRRAEQPLWLLWQTFAKKREDGSPVWSREDPKIPPNHGADLMCPCNPKSPEYPSLKAMGFRDCKKQHIPHRDALNRHVQKSHGRAWEAMEQNREVREREEDRQLQREGQKIQKDTLEALTGAAVKGIQTETIQAEPVQMNGDGWESATTDTAAYNPDIPVTLTGIHPHLYRGKDIGAPCKIDGCSAVRKQAFKPHRSKSRS